MAVNWLKNWKLKAKQLEDMQVQLVATKASLREAEGRERQARHAQAEAEYHAKAAMAFKDEVLFLRSLVKDLTVQGRIRIIHGGTSGAACGSGGDGFAGKNGIEG